LIDKRPLPTSLHNLKRDFYFTNICKISDFSFITRYIRLRYFLTGREYMKYQNLRLQLRDTHADAHIQTNIEDDYVRQSFQDLVTGPNILYGLCADNELASIGGYSIYAEQLAMLGRLRSDVRFHGHGFATELMAYIR